MKSRPEAAATTLPLPPATDLPTAFGVPAWRLHAFRSPIMGVNSRVHHAGTTQRQALAKLRDSAIGVRHLYRATSLTVKTTILYAVIKTSKA